MTGALSAAPARPSELRERGFVLFNAGRFQAALPLFLRAARAGDLESLRFGAHCLQSLGRSGEARALLARLLRESGREDVRLELARLLLLQGRLAQAKKALGGGRLSGPSAAPRRAMLAQLLLEEAARARESGRRAAAVRLLEKAHALSAGGPARDALAAALLEACDAEAEAGRLARAAALAERAARVDPRSAAAARRRSELAAEQARALESAGRGHRAEALLRQALRRRPDAEEVRHALVGLLRRRAGAARGAGDGAAAQRALERALRDDPAAFEARRELAALLRERAAQAEAQGRKAPALRLWAKAARAGRAGATARVDRFRALARAGRLSEAFEEGERLLDASPTLHERRALLNPWDEEPRGEARRELARLAEAVRAPRLSPWRACFAGFLTGDLSFFGALERAETSRYGWLLYRSGQSLLCQERFDEARRHFELALACPPVDWRAATFLAETLLCQGRQAEALSRLERAAALAPREEAADAFAWRGAFDLWLGRYAEAEERLGWAAALGGGHARAWRAAALLKLGRAAQALEELDEALAADAGDREARVWRAEALRALGRHREAEAEASREPVGFWARVNRALARRALGDEAGFAEDYAALPKTAIERAAAGLPPAASPAQRLEAALEKARGFRREDYGDAIWTRAAD